jgi:ketosteroid isomerase-like protein/predicted aspartyl protease
MNMEDDWGRAYGRKDVAALERILADDLALVSSNGDQFTKRRIIDDYANSVVCESVAYSDRLVRVFGATAISTGVCIVKGRNKERDFSAKIRYTHVFVKRNGRWQVVAAQATDATPRQSVQKIPFELFRNSLIFVQARINNSEPMWFMVDTGSTFSFLDTAKADALGIKTEGRQTLTGGGGGSFEITFAKGLSLDVSGVKLSDQSFAITPWKNRYDRNVVGLVGAPFLKQFVVEIDYQSRNLLIHDPRSYQYSGSGSVIALDFRDEIPYIKVSVAIGARDPVEAGLMVDTGAGQTIVLDPPFVEANKMLEAALDAARQSRFSNPLKRKFIGTLTYDFRLGGLMSGHFL